MKQKREPIRHPVEIQQDGKTYSGTYYESKGMVYVDYQGRQRVTQLGGLSAEDLAPILLSQLVQGKK